MIKKLFITLPMFLLFTISQSEIIEKDTIEFNQEELLEDILGEESSIVELLEPEFQKIGDKLLSKPNINFRSRIIKKLQRSKGFEEKIFLGNSLNSYQRLRIGNKMIEGALLLKKDPGERSYAEFTNYYLQISNLFNVKKVIIGDYIIEAGQGLCFWRNYYFSKGVNFPITLIRNGKELQGYNSSDEIGFMRGVAAQFVFYPFELITFYSNRKLTASLDSNSYIKYFYSPYFSTLNDLQKKYNTKEELVGARLFNKGINYKVGLNIFKIKYSHIVQNIQTNNFISLGVDYVLNLNSIDISLESFFNNLKYLNSIVALKFNPSQNIAYFVSYRNYAKNTFNRFSNPFGESNGGNNEIGFFCGINWKINNYFLLNGFVDYFKSHFTDKMNSQKNGREYFVQIKTGILKKLELIFRYRNKVYNGQTKQIDSYNREITINDIYKKNSFRLNLDYKIHSKAKYRLRAEYLILGSDYKNEKEYGRLLYHDLNYVVFHNLILSFRVTLFSTSTFYSGISVYENDLDGVLSNPILYGRGIKWYIMIKYKNENKFLVSLKYSYLMREDTRKIGSGWDQLPANVDNRISFQVELNL